MSLRLRLTIAAAVALVACGPGEGQDPPLAQAGDTVAASVTAETVADSAPAIADTAAIAASGAVVPASSQELTVDERIERLLAAQEALALRLDSLTLVGAAPVDSAADVETGDALGEGVAAPGDVLGQAGDQVRGFGLGVAISILVVALFSLVIRSLTWVLDTLSERSVARRLFFKRLVPIVRIVLWIFAAYLIVRVIFRVDAQGFLAATAAVGVAVGFAAQDLLKNLFGGLILVFDQPFQVGDKIRVGGTYGEVVSIGLRSTRIVTSDDNRVTVPNAQVVDQQVANANAGELNCQVVIDLYLPGFVDESRAKKIAFESAASSKYIYLNKPIVVLVKDEFKETFLTRVRVKAYVLDPRFEFLFESDVTERAREGFRDAGLLSPGHGLRAWVALSDSAVTTRAAPVQDEHAGD